ncbi:tyrosine-type recombinase/integrase [Ensifer sp. NBAIM29]|nr:tyrosine-type recombinase/integrase [Ensifer sp. NBAIM29]
MAKAKKLTQPAIDKQAYKPELKDGQPKKVTYYPDAGKPGLYLVVHASGKYSWWLFYRLPGDPKKRKKVYSGFPTLAAVHKLAQADLDAAAEGRDPAAEKAEQRRQAKAGIPEGKLFRNVVERYLEHYKEGRGKNRKPAAKTFDAVHRALGLAKDQAGEWQEIALKKGERKHPIAAWGQRPIDTIAKHEVHALLDEMVSTGRRKAGGSAYQANRTYAYMRPLFEWARKRGLIEVSPCVDWDKAVEERRTRHNYTSAAFTREEIGWFWQATGRMGWPYGPIFRLLLLTGCRSREVGELRWSEVDIPNRLLNIPGSRTKNKLPLTLPLSGEALAILEGLPRVPNEAGYVFWTGKGKGAVDASSSNARERCHGLMEAIASEEGGEPVTIPHWVIHSTRDTVSTHMHESPPEGLGVLPHVVDSILNHKKPGVSGKYNGADYLSWKRDALQRWAAFVVTGRAPVGGNVVPLQRSA